jgi:cytochrome c551/c552
MTHRQRLVLITVLLAAAGCSDDFERSAAQLNGGDPGNGRAAIDRYGCSSCHTIPHVRGADALVGPSLDWVGNRVYIDGVLENSPQNMRKRILNPPPVDPLTAMSNLHVSEDDARDIAGVLYTLR